MEKQSIRQKALEWWNSLASLEKTRLCDNNTEIVGHVRRWESLTGREIELIFKENIHIVICENCKEYHYSDKDRCSCGSSTFSKTHESNWVHIK